MFVCPKSMVLHRKRTILQLSPCMADVEGSIYYTPSYYLLLKNILSLNSILRYYFISCQSLLFVSSLIKYL
jgi:hypothetical protein